MSASSIYNPRIMMRNGTNPVDEMIPAPEAAQQSYLIRELVYLTGGRITVCGSDPTVIAGIAAKAATGTTAADGFYYPIRPDDEVLMFVYQGGSTDALAETDRGVEYGIVAASNVWYIDLNDTSNDRVVIKRLLYDPEGTLLTDRCIVNFIPAYLQTAGATA